MRRLSFTVRRVRRRSKMATNGEGLAGAFIGVLGTAMILDGVKKKEVSTLQGTIDQLKRRIVSGASEKVMLHRELEAAGERERAAERRAGQAEQKAIALDSNLTDSINTNARLRADAEALRRMHGDEIEALKAKLSAAQKENEELRHKLAAK
jgi:hypothetical protein